MAYVTKVVSMCCKAHFTGASTATFRCKQCHQHCVTGNLHNRSERTLVL